MTTGKSAKIPPKPGKDTVYVDVDDEITAVIDKVEGAKEKVVALVLPKRAAVLQSVVNMRLLKRNSEKAGKNVVLITSEEALLPLAGAVGLHVAKNLQSKPEIPAAPSGLGIKKTNKKAEEELTETNDEAAEPETTKLDYHRSIGELAAANADDEGDAIDLEDEDAAEAKSKEPKVKKSKVKGLKVPNFDRFRLLLLGGGTLFILLIVFIVLAIVVLPKATITIKTESLPISANLNLDASDSVKTLDEAGNKIPAQLKTSKQTDTQQVTATGKQNNGTKATGSASLTAQDCSAPFSTPADVPAGTGLSSNGLTYISQDNISFSISGASGSCVDYSGNAATHIKAQGGGANYNVSSVTFAVSGRTDVSATGSASGGTDNNITVVSQSDIDGAKSKISSADSDKFSKDFEKQLADQGSYVLSSTLKLSDPATKASPALGQQATTSTVVVEITYTVLVVQKSDLTKAITDALNKQIDKGKQKLSDTNVLDKATVTVQNQNSASSVTLNVEENTTAVPTLDIASIKKQATGQKVGDIKSAISGLPGVKSVDVNLSPFWVSKAPKVSKITVVQQQVKNGGG